LRKLETDLKLNFKYPKLILALVSDRYFVPDVGINSMFVLPKLKLPIGLKMTDCPERCPYCYRKYSDLEILDWNIGFLKCYLFREFRMKYFKDIEIPYEKKNFLYNF